MSQGSDVVVVGGGAVGGAVALALAGHGASVTVVESGRVGRGATWASAGALAPDWGEHSPPALSALADASFAMWPSWAAEVEGRSGVGLNLRRDGLISVWLDPDAPDLPPELATEPPRPSDRGQPLSADDVRALEPLLTGPVAGGVLYPGDCQVDNARLAPALLRAAASLGTRVLAETPVAALLGPPGRCTGVRTASGLDLHAGAVVLAAGAWSGPFAAASGVNLPVAPWRGQMLAFDTPVPVLRHLVFSGELVMVPRPHGPLVVGTTLEDVGFDARVTLDGLRQITARAARVAPALGDRSFSRAWAGLRPGTPDGLPYLGPVPGRDGLFAATGHGRKGVVLAPITGALMAPLVLEGALDPLLVPCLPSRVDAGVIPDTGGEG